MVIKPFSHLARQSFAKTLAHGYAQSVVAASQSSYATTAGTLGQFQSYPAHKFTRTTQLQNVFQNASGSSGPGARAGQTGQGTSSGGDGGLAAYYAAWQHAQQTGDESDWRQHSFSKRIGWNTTSRANEIKRIHRRESSLTPDCLRPLHTTDDGALPENDIAESKPDHTARAEAEALRTVDEAIAQEVVSFKEADTASDPTQDALLLRSTERGSTDPERHALSGPQVADGDQILSTKTDGSIKTAPSKSTSTQPYGDEIFELARNGQYADVPTLFERMLKTGIIPSTEEYNVIIESAIHLSGGVYQVLPKALEIYGDMIRRNVLPDENTHIILIKYLTAQARDAYAARSALQRKQSRFGSESGEFLFQSHELENELLAEDASLDFALKQYQTVKARFTDIRLPAQVYSALVHTCAQYGRPADMSAIYLDMKAQKVTPPGMLFISMIKAHAQAKDLKAANKLYEDYRILSTSKQHGESNVAERQDMLVYVALAKAFMTTENISGAFKFLNRILRSYDDTAESTSLKSNMETIFCSTLVEDALERLDFDTAITLSQARELDETSRRQVLSQICSVAAASSNLSAANNACSLMDSSSTEFFHARTDIFTALLRANRIEDAQGMWESLVSGSELFPSAIEVTTMYARALMRQGQVEEALSQGREMFKRVRDSAQDAATHAGYIEQIDEAVSIFSGQLYEGGTAVNPLSSILMIRIMAENRGLIPHITERCIASLGPACVDQLGPMDMALALHVQAMMLTKDPRAADIASEQRFAHLLQTLIIRNESIDPTTLHAVTDALPCLRQTRPDLVQAWQGAIQRSQNTETVSTQLMTPSPTSPAVGRTSHDDSYDPHANNTDYRTSSMIADLLENPSGRPENHLREAMNRFRDVRRTGRHTRYTTYAKLITAAGKTGQVNLVHEIYGMARHDVPLDLRYSAVKAGWVSILDSMVAACLYLGDRQLASRYHQEMLDMGTAPSANTFGLYITTLKESTRTFDEATEAVRIFQRALTEGVEPGVFLFNAVIGKLGRARRVDDCLKYFTEMQTRNLQPTSVTYGTLVNALCRTSEETLAENLFDEMEAQPNYRPRAAPYNSIIQYFLNTKRNRSKVITYYERMTALNIKPTSHTYKLLIEAHASLQPINIQSAEAVLDVMRAAGMEPEAVHYGTLIHAKGCVMHDMVGARALFDQVLASGTIRPTDNLYQNLFESMVANHQVAETEPLVRGMATRNVQMTAYIANTLIHGWAAQRNIARARAIFDGLGYAKREPSTYEAMTRAYLAMEDRRGAASIVNEMRSKGYPAAVAEKILVLVGDA